MTNNSSVAIRSEPSSGFDVKIAKIKALMGGTYAMRNAGETYLPQFEGEGDDHYKARKAMSVLFNGTQKTVNDMVSRVFEKPIELSEETDQQFKDWAENINMEGQDLSNFAADVLSKGLQTGIQYLMVDAPAKQEGETARTDDEEGNRPYIVSIDPEDVLGWKTTKVGNETVISQIRIQESVEEDKAGDEFAVETIKQIRVHDLIEGRVLVRVFRESKNAGSEAAGWVQHGEDAWIDLDRITVTPFYAHRLSFFKGDPPLDDLSDLNVAHWQSNSDQRNILHFARVPILFGSGFGKNEDIKISASTITRSEDPAATLSFVEHSGAAIGAGQKDLEHLEWMMETHGLQLLVQQNGPQTATGENRNERKETSRLSMIADNLKDALEICFGWMGDYQNIEFNGAVVINKDFASNFLDVAGLNALISMVNSGKLSKKSFWIEMVRRGVLREDFELEDEQDFIDLEGDEFTDEVDVSGDKDEDED